LNPTYHGVVVIGSGNADMVIRVDRRPLGGETILGGDVEVLSGGKGANQAVAAGRLGAPVRFIGSLGHDSYGDLIVASLQSSGASTEHVFIGERPTGIASIYVTPDGENSIVVAPGANSDLTVERIDKLNGLFNPACIVVLQLEVPVASVEHAARTASARGARVVLNAAPAAALSQETLACADPLILNEREAEFYLASDLGSDADEVLAARLRTLGAASVIVTLGGAGALVVTPYNHTRLPAPKVVVVDSTGAGDAFVGAVAAELLRDGDLVAAAEFAIRVASTAVTTAGAQSSFPFRDDLPPEGEKPTS
jgi:ribokinase